MRRRERHVKQERLLALCRLSDELHRSVSERGQYPFELPIFECWPLNVAWLLPTQGCGKNSVGMPSSDRFR